MDHSQRAFIDRIDAQNTKLHKQFTTVVPQNWNKIFCFSADDVRCQIIENHSLCRVDDY